MKIEKDLRDRYTDSLKAIQEAETDLNAIQDKQTQIQESLPEVEKAVQKAEQEKAQSIDDFCLSKVDQKTVDLKTEAFGWVTSKLKCIREILEVLGQKEIAAQDQLSRLRDKHNRIENEIWNLLFEQIQADTRASIQKQLHRAFAVNARRSSSMTWIDFLGGLVERCEKEHLETLAPEIDKLFQEAVRG